MFRALLVFLFAGLLAAAIRSIGFENHRLLSDSMAPLYPPGSVILVDKAYFSIRLPFSTYEVARRKEAQIGEVVLVSHPYDVRQTHLRRVAAVGKDQVTVQNGRLIVNGNAAGAEGGSWGPDYGPVDVPPDHIFVLNDRREDGSDSRQWGPVPVSCLLGKAQLVLWPR